METRLHEGGRVGRWTLVRRTVLTKRSKWWCRCDCGTEKEVHGSSLLSGTSLSCGCLRAEELSERSTTHGGSKEPLYRVWAAMMGRCYDANDRFYKDYGGRGVKVCRRWHSYTNFRLDMGDRPSDKHSLDRRKNHLGYSKANCVWSTTTEQARNRRSNRMITYKGRTQCLQAWAEELGVSRSRLSTRLDRQGLSVHEAFTRPSRYHK